MVSQMSAHLRKMNRLVPVAFALGVALLILGDVFLAAPPSNSFTFWLSVSNTSLDLFLFSLVFLLLKREVRKRRDIIDQLAEANRLKNEFLRIAAHDLRSPLNAISLVASQLPTESPQEPRSVASAGGEIRSAARDMLGIIEGVLEAVVLEEGTLILHRQPTDLGLCVGEVVERNRRLSDRKQQEILFSSCEMHWCEIDGARIKQAVDNLIGNAIKFSPRGETITVTIHSEGSNARIEVTDHGPGLTEDDKKGVFGQFQRLSARPTGGETSTGLGLSNARRLVELNGGQIGAESAGPGQGSRFWIELPEEPVTQPSYVAEGI